ncbi:hypothetical protein CJA_0315 [Cellvibrio japonicus Ueda107]|uniref:Uncharacterized protein n=1 Tax=Cellvibrio japonicus (strain Ueda107) TaxID=498211 RepID=B3PHB8_CELJU|nr:hypothetical protein CJA_0315 [Cellvibrio japonicus Ueda107]
MRLYWIADPNTLGDWLDGVPNGKGIRLLHAQFWCGTYPQRLVFLV